MAEIGSVYCEEFGIKDSLSLGMSDISIEDDDDWQVYAEREGGNQNMVQQIDGKRRLQSNELSRLGPHFFLRSARKILLLLKFLPHPKATKHTVLSIPVHRVDIAHNVEA